MCLLSRRGLLAGSLGGLVVAASGCDAVDDVLGGDEADAPGGSASPEPAVDADSALVAEVGTAIAEVRALALATAKEVPALARPADRLARLHAAHLDRLGWDGERPTTSTGGEPRAVVRRRLLRAEAGLQESLVAAAGRAESGALAQVMAAMAAAVAQQRAVLA